MNQNDNKENEENQIVIGIAYLSNLTEGAIDYFTQAVKEYAERLKRESENIEYMEHTGEGPPEITAAHVQEAKWVSLRRMRRRATSSKWNAILRLGQLVMSTVVGIGASNFTQTWGALMCVIGVLMGSILLIAERELTRES